MKTKLLRLLSGSALAMAANTAAALLATMWLDPTERGHMVTSVTIAAFIPIVAAMGSGTALRVLLPKAGPAETASLKSAYTWLTSAALVGGAVVGGLAMAAFDMATTSGLGTLSGFAALTAWSVGQQILLIQASDARYASGEFRRTPLWAAAAGLAGLILMAVVPPEARSGATLLTAQLAGLSLITVLNVVSTAREGYLAAPRPQGAWKLVRQGLPVVPMGLGWAAIQRSNRLVAAAMLGPATVAVLALAATAAETARLVPNATGQLTLHSVASSSGRPRMMRSYIVATSLTAAVLVVISAVMWFATVPVFGAEYRQVPALIVTMIGVELCYAVYIVSNRAMLGLHHSSLSLIHI